MEIFRKNNLTLRVVKYIFIILVAFIISLPLTYVQAQQDCGGVGEPPCNGTIPPDNGTIPPGNGTIPPDNGTIPPGNGTIPPDNGIKINSGIKNPLGNSFADIPSFIKAVLRFFLLIGIPIITLAIIYSGFLFVTAQGNSEKLKSAKKALIYTLVGAALLLGSLVITDAIQGTVDDIKKTTK